VTPAEPHVVAILVTHDGAPLLRRTLTAVAAQTYAALDLVAVDNGSTDGTTALLIELLGPDRVVLSDRDLGFPAAIDLALDVVDARAAGEGRSTADDLVLVLHDDLELAPDAVARLVEALADDERVAIVGPKLRWADDPDRLQSVGATIDLTGRVDDGIDPGELDQGQRDGDRRVLFVPTAGMMVRRSLLDTVGRFDRRFHAFREDLDLCWRAALAGYDVEVVPAAVAQHASLSAEHLRGGRVAELGPRFLAERNTLAALLKNYEARRLIVLLPLALLVGGAKVIGFLLTRRLGDARDTVVAWGWNVVNLRGTIRRRRQVQALRRRSDAELAPLFGRVTPRLRAYLEAVLDRIAGDALPGEASIAEYAPSAMLMGELTVELEEELRHDLASVALVDDALEMDHQGEHRGEHEGEYRGGPEAPRPDAAVLAVAGAAAIAASAGPTRPVGLDEVAPATLRGRLALRGRRLRWKLADAPVRVLLPPLVVLLAVGLRQLFIPGPIRGGDLLPFPDGPGLLARHLASWHDSGATLSSVDPSPAQLILGLLQLVPGGVGLRLLLLVVPLLAWALAMRALAPIVPSGLSRTVLAAAYATSAPALAAVAGGDLQGVVLVLGLPALVITFLAVLDPATVVETVWRRLAMSVLVIAVMVAFVPPLVLLLPLGALAGVAHAYAVERDARWRTTLAARSVVLGVLPLPLLGPWLRTLPAELRDVLDGPSAALGGHPLTWLALDPSRRVAGIAGAALAVTAIAGALITAPRRPRSAVVLLLLSLGAPLAAWGADAAGLALRPSVLLVPATFAMVVLAGLGITAVPELLRSSDFGWRQVSVSLLIVATVVMTVVGAVAHAIAGAPALTRDEAIPAFVATLGPHAPERVLVLGATDGGVVWEVVPAAGPTLAAFGVRHEPATQERLARAVEDLLSAGDPRAAAALGRLGIGAVVVPAGFADPTLDLLLRSQAALDPLPSLTGTISRVSGAVPGAAVVRGLVVGDRVPDPTVPPRVVVSSFERTGATRYAGVAGAAGELVATVPFGAGWRVLVDGSPRPMLVDDGMVRVLDVPAGADVELVAGVDTFRQVALRAQLLVFLLVVSLGARPPQLALRNARRRSEVSGT
jgi:GT2 family glycosyltransferase